MIFVPPSSKTLCGNCAAQKVCKYIEAMKDFKETYNDLMQQKCGEKFSGSVIYPSPFELEIKCKYFVAGDLPHIRTFEN
jgi:hypothetical protein